jgi:hypothetical protein
MLLLSAGAGFQGQEGVGRAVAAPAGMGSSRYLGDAAALDTLRGAVGVADHHAVAYPPWGTHRTAGTSLACRPRGSACRVMGWLCMGGEVLGRAVTPRPGDLTIVS